MKKKAAWLLAGMLCLTLWTPTVEAGRRIEGMVGFIEILTGAERAHGREQEVSGYIKKYEQGYALFRSEADYFMETKENGIWLPALDDSIEPQESGLFWRVRGYINLNDKGPDSAFAATLQQKPVEEPYQKPEPVAREIEGESWENACKINGYELVANPYAYEGKYVEIQGICSRIDYNHAILIGSTGSGNQMMIEKEEINRENLEIYNFSEEIYEQFVNQDTVRTSVEITVIGKYEWRQLRGGIWHYLTDIKKIEVAEKDLAWFEENNAAYRRMKEENGW